MLSYSVIVCTLERRDDLRRCIESWLRQSLLPLEIVVVHGGTSPGLEKSLENLLRGSRVALRYLRTPPSLVRQRNAGVRLARGDIVFFADDDAVYDEGYAKAVLDVYEADSSNAVGGVQGTIVNFDRTLATRSGFANLFLLTRLNGDGTLQASGWPAFCTAREELAQVEVFSGPAMSFRREVLEEFEFDDALADFYAGDDFEFAFRVSRKYELYQAPAARLTHYLSPAGRDSVRRGARMSVVNHYYLSRKLLGGRRKTRAAWAWSELGNSLLAASWLVAGRGSGRILGTLDGYRDLLRGRGRLSANGSSIEEDE